MGTGRIIGGIIALLAGALVVVMCLQFTILITSTPVAWVLNLSVACLAIVSGILGFGTKRSAGWVALVAGLLAIICEIVATTDPATFAGYLNQYSFFGGYILIPWVTVEAILMLLGGIIMLASAE